MRARGWLNQEDDRCCQVSPAVAGKIGVGAYLLIGFGLVCVERKLQYAVDSFAGLLCRSPRALDTTKGGGGRGSNNSSSIICCRARTSHLLRHGRSQTCIRRLPPPQLVVGCGLLAFFLPACRRALPLQVSRKNSTYIRSGAHVVQVANTKQVREYRVYTLCATLLLLLVCHGEGPGQA